MIMFLLIGLLFFLIGAGMLVAHLRFKKIAQKTRGRVVGFETHQGGKHKNTTMYSAVVEFEQGKSYRFKSSFSSSRMSFEIGQQVEVLFDPNNPTKAKIARKAHILFPLFFMAFSSIFIAVGSSKITWTNLNIGLVAAEIIIGLLVIFKISGSRKADAKKAQSEAYRNTDSLSGQEGVLESDEQDAEQDFDLFEQNDNQMEGYQPTQNMLREGSQIQQLKEKQKTPNWLKVVGLVLGLGALGGGAYWAHSQYDFMQNAEQAEGRVTGFATHYSDGTKMYAPLVEFEDRQKAKHQFKSSISSSSPSYSRNQAVRVFYQAENPQDAMLDRGWFNWLFQGILITIGLVISLLSLKSIRKASAPREI